MARCGATCSSFAHSRLEPLDGGNGAAADGSGGCWFAAEDGTAGRVLSDGRILHTQLPDDAWPTALIADGDFAWVLTERGSWRIWLAP